MTDAEYEADALAFTSTEVAEAEMWRKLYVRKDDGEMTGRYKYANQHIFPPEDGWQDHTVYVVEVSFEESNPVHWSLFYSGVLNGRDDRDWPGGYNTFPLTAWSTIGDVYYMRVYQPIWRLDPTDVHKDTTAFMPDEAIMKLAAREDQDND